MEPEIPNIVGELYQSMVTGPTPDFWPENLRDKPVQGHGLWSFYQGLRLGLQLSHACLETL